jgi:glycosyltransferase involved in cell wall biosynthesis
VVELPGSSDAGSLRVLFAEARTAAVLERYALGGGAALEGAVGLGLPCALEVNAPLAEEAARFRGLQDVDQWKRRECSLLAAAPHLIVVSSALRDHAVASGAARERITVIPNGVDLESFGADGGHEIRERLGLGTDIVVGFVGSLKPWHGVARLVQAMRNLPVDFRLLVVGEGPERQALELLSQKIGLGVRARFTGGVPHAQVPSFLAAMDMGVAPFELVPGFYFSPLKVVEYMAAGLPVVATRQGDLMELVADGGLLVEPGDVEGLRAALQSLGEDAGLRLRLGTRARERARRFGWDSVAERVEGVLAGRRLQRTSA